MKEYPLSFHWFNTLNRWLELATITRSESDFDIYIRNAAVCRANMEMALASETVAGRKHAS